MPIEMAYKVGQKDFRLEVERVKNAKPDAVVHWGNAVEGALILNTMREMGMTQPFYGCDRTVSDDVQVYIDATPPEVELSGPLEFVLGDEMAVVASASDDFAVARGTAYYELEEGGYGSVAMALSGTELTAAIPSSFLWDGMDVYVTATDDAGNSAESEHMAAAEVSSLSGGQWYTSAAVLASVAAGVCVLAIIVFTVVRRRPEKRSGERPAGRIVHDAHVVHETGQTPPPVAVLPRIEARPGPVVLDRVPAMSASAGIPGAVVIGRTVTEPDAQEEDIDYGELIERELIQGVFNRSPYREVGYERPEASRPDPSPQKGRIIPFLKLKRMLDRDDDLEL